MSGYIGLNRGQNRRKVKVVSNINNKVIGESDGLGNKYVKLLFKFYRV